MLDKLQKIADRFNELTESMALPQVATNHIKLAECAQERAELEPLVTRYQDYVAALRQIKEAEALLNDSEMAELAQSELDELYPRAAELEGELKRMLLPKDPRDDKNVLIEIRAGAGGDEAGLFGAELARMYMRYAENHGWKTEMLSLNETGVGGYKEAVFKIDGRGAYSRLKWESGVHRVQRVPITESSGRIHTSTATVAVLPEMDDFDIKIDPNDIEIETYCSSGPGGQHMQKNATAIRIIHKPSGMVVTCENQRSLTQNRLQALGILRSRLYAIEEEKRFAEQDANRRSQVGSGDRSEKIRTYNYPQNRVTDHRIGISSYNLVGVLDGDLDQFIDELATSEEATRLQSLGDA